MRIAFENDFDTPEVFRILMMLINEGLQYALFYWKNVTNSNINSVNSNSNDSNHNRNNISHQPIEPLLSIGNYVNKIVNILGLQFNTNTNTNTNDDDYIEKIVEFRYRYKYF